MKFKLILVLFLITATTLPAATLSGLVKDGKTNKALAYANIAVYEKDSKTVKTGTMSGVDGTFRIFNVPTGDYYLVITYIGYEKKQVNDINIAGKKTDIGTILLTPKTIKMEDVTVEAQKPPIRYEIDKEVIDARQFLSAYGGSAIDILINVPSVTVDINRKVSLQGNSSITVMIDGRTSILEPEDALECIPAESVENIEIMTNPSAKFEANGGAGIINIVTKKNKRIGLTGLTSVKAGNHNLNGSATVSYTHKKMMAFVSFNQNISNFGGESYSDRYMYYPDTTVNHLSEATRDSKNIFGGIKGGLDWFISKNDVVGLLANYYPRTSSNSNVKDYSVRFLDPGSDVVFTTQDYINYENRNNNSMRFNAVADYTHTFPDKKEEHSDKAINEAPDNTTQKVIRRSRTKHQIKIAASFSDRDTDNELSTYLVDISGDTTEGQWTSTIGPMNNIRAKLEYKRPINNSSYFETGAHANFNWKTDGNNIYQYNPFTGDLDIQDQFSNHTDYKQNTLAAYALYTAEFGKLGIKPGIRTEYTYREIDSDAIDSVYVFDDLSIFPSLNISYQLPSDIQLRGSYSRRINRPSGSQLEPFYTWVDAYNIRIGNPALKPEISESFGLGVMKNFKKFLISMNASYNQSKDMIEPIRSVYGDDSNVILRTYENIGKRQSLNLNTTLDFNLFSWWKISLWGSLGYSHIEGELYGEDISKEYVNYFTHIFNSFTLPTKTGIQLIAMYYPKHATVQGSSSGGLYTNLSISQNFFNGKLTASLQVDDIFGTNVRKNEIITPTTYTYSEYYSDTPSISLYLSLRINNYKRQRAIDSFESDGFDVDGSGEY